MILEVGQVAAGGACVARADDGRVVFVRHALPGERVRVDVTATTKHFLRADAVEVLVASPARVARPCPFAGPGRCGGCDWQHVEPAEQRALKAALVLEQLARLAGVTRSLEVEEVPGGALGWRTRVQWAVAADGTPGLHRHRSRELELVTDCLIAAPRVALPLGSSWKGTRSVEAFAVDGQVVLAVDGRPAALPAVDAGLVVDGRAVRSPHGIRTTVLGRTFEVSAGGFWQVHHAAPAVLGAAVLDALQPQPGERGADLYAGVGLFSSLLGAAVGPSGSVVAVESSPRASADAARNTSDQPWVRVRTAEIDVALIRSLQGLRPELIVLDPPRAGAGLEVTTALAGLRPRALAFVACDPASFARDLRVLLDAGWTLESLRALDIYPMTEHVELVALLHPPA